MQIVQTNRYYTVESVLIIGIQSEPCREKTWLQGLTRGKAQSCLAGI